MSKGLKIALIILALIIVLISVGGYIALKIFGEAFGTECEEAESWTIEQYEIQEYKCLGWAGPHYYPLHLYENEKEIATNGYKLDSCTIRFIPKKDQYLKIDICNSEVTILTPNKKPLELNKVDSIIMVNIEIQQRKILSSENVREFVQKWNRAPVHDYRDNEKPFYPTSSYYFKVYQNKNVRTFETGNFMIKDDQNWSYTFLEEGEENSTKKFDEMWNEIKTTANKTYKQ